MNSFLLVCDVFFVVFWKNPRPGKKRFEIIWPLLPRKCYWYIGTLLYLDEMNHKSGFFICHSDPKFEIGFWNGVENEDLFTVCIRHAFWPGKNQKYFHFLLLKIFNSKWKGAYFCLLIFFNLFGVPDINLATVFWRYFLKTVKTMYVVMIGHFGPKSQRNHQTCFSTEARMHLWSVWSVDVRNRYKSFLKIRFRF